MKYAHVYALLLIFGFLTACGQNQTNVPQDNIRDNRANYPESQLKEADTSKVPMSMVRSVKQARNGDILVASYLGVFRYDGTSFTNLTGKMSSPRFSSFWDVLEDQRGNLWFASKDSGVYYYNGKSFQHFTTQMGLPVIWRFIFMKIKPAISGSEQVVTMENLFEILQRKTDFPVTVFVYSLKTKPASFGLVHKEKICSFMMEKHLPF
jgi:hypothetical protein